MAISTGVNPHRAWLSVNGAAQIPILTGTCTQQGTRKSSVFSASVPLNYPGAADLLSNLGDNNSGIVVESNGKQAVLVLGEIDTTDFHFGQNGTIVVTGRDNSVKLHNKIHHGKFPNKTTVAVVEQVAGEAGLSVVISGGSGMMIGTEISDEFVDMADGKSLASIVTKCAELDNARWFVDNGSTLHYEINPQPSSAVYSVTYTRGPPEKADFFTLSIKRNVQAGKTIEVFVKSWREEDKKPTETVGTVPGNGGPVEYEITLPNWKEEQASKYAQNKANEIARHEITVNAHVVGDVTIDVDDGLSVFGTGVFDQRYLIDSIHHQFGMQGHTMTITARSGRGGRGS